MKNISLHDLYCSVPRTNYSEALIEQLGESINAVGGLLRPLIVESTPGAAAFEVVDGVAFYYAALYAQKNNILFEHVPCWVLADPEDLDSALEQLEHIASYGCVIE